ncbi:FAD-dependent oxidoreductase [Saccharothrix violaceirubra]|uniref:NADH dehydrogenase FAD-containing subunit n=1 Tax=Saccharothrix violaceirubra TaxID=413306 RepID=A0A7W7SZQ9_9PSEU|nr:FAD-dependent oxidoreductase [Saccharothrix violaceirubra]MBB4963909.1 NADH dehydrogenase FAD-containing subunit [Saccharothrix violaceirubra]
MAEHIVVVGGGYTGLAAAKLLARWTEAEVTLVNDRDRFVERVRLHEFAAGRTPHDLPLTGLLDGTGVRLVVDRVTRIDADTREITLETGRLHYDRLVYALGSRADLDSVPGAREHAFTVATREEAERLRVNLTTARSVVVIGGGLTGIEAAAELAEAHPHLAVTLATGGVFGGALSAKGRRHLRRVFDRLGVTVVDDARVTEVRADGVVLADREITADTVVWTAGFRVPDLAREAGFEVDGRGRLVVDGTLSSVSHPEVIGVGDAAAVHRPDGLELRMACATGLPTTQYAIRTVAARLSGRVSKPLRFGYALQCVSLGRRDGLIQFVRGDDSPRELVLTGRLAARVKEAVVRGTVLFERHPTIPTSF